MSSLWLDSSIEVNDLPKLDPILDQTSALLAELDDTVDAL